VLPSKLILLELKVYFLIAFIAIGYSRENLSEKIHKEKI
jgi:hypothetical protein